MPQEYAMMKDKPYCEAIGSLNYMLQGTHPNIAYIMSVLSCYLDNPGLVHWEVVKWVFAYLFNLDLKGYSDADGSMDVAICLPDGWGSSVVEHEEARHYCFIND